MVRRPLSLNKFNGASDETSMEPEDPEVYPGAAAAGPSAMQLSDDIFAEIVISLYGLHMDKQLTNSWYNADFSWAKDLAALRATCKRYHDLVAGPLMADVWKVCGVNLAEIVQRTSAVPMQFELLPRYILDYATFLGDRMTAVFSTKAHRRIALPYHLEAPQDVVPRAVHGLTVKNVASCPRLSTIWCSLAFRSDTVEAFLRNLPKTVAKLEATSVHPKVPVGSPAMPLELDLSFTSAVSMVSVKELELTTELACLLAKSYVKQWPVLEQLRLVHGYRVHNFDVDLAEFPALEVFMYDSFAYFNNPSAEFVFRMIEKTRTTLKTLTVKNVNGDWPTSLSMEALSVEDLRTNCFDSDFLMLFGKLKKLTMCGSVCQVDALHEAIALCSAKNPKLSKVCVDSILPVLSSKAVHSKKDIYSSALTDGRFPMPDVPENALYLCHPYKTLLTSGTRRLTDANKFDDALDLILMYSASSLVTCSIDSIESADLTKLCQVATNLRNLAVTSIYVLLGLGVSTNVETLHLTGYCSWENLDVLEQATVKGSMDAKLLGTLFPMLKDIYIYGYDVPCRLPKSTKGGISVHAMGSIQFGEWVDAQTI